MYLYSNMVQKPFFVVFLRLTKKLRILAPINYKAGFCSDILHCTMVLNLGLVLEKLSGFYNSARRSSYRSKVLL